MSSQERNRGPQVLFSVKAKDVLLCKEAALQPTGRRVQVRTPAEMMTEMDDPMVLESNLAARAWEKQQALLKYSVLENSIVDSPATDAMEVTEQVVGMETSPRAWTRRPVGDDMSKPGDGAQSEAPQEVDLALPMKPNEVGRVIELPFEISSFSSRKSGNFNDNSGGETSVAQKKRKERGKNWAQKDTDVLLRAVLNTKKVSTRMEQGIDCDSHWDAVAKAVPDRTGDECRGRMDTLKRSFSTMKKYCDEQVKEFKQLKEDDFLEMKVSPRLTEAWYNQIRDYCPPRPKKKSKSNGAGSSSKRSAFTSDSSTLDLQPPVLPDGIDQGEPALVTPGPVTLPMEDPPACLEFQVADPLQRQTPPVPQNADDAEDFIEDLFPDPLRQQAPPVPLNADVAEDFMEDMFPSFEFVPYPWL